MGLSGVQKDRLRAIAREVQEIVGGCLHADGRPRTFSELEDECLEAGDLLTTEVLQQRVRQREVPQRSPCCPTCDRPAERCPDEPRTIQADRGEVGWMEPTYFCHRCRRSFFPSVGGTGAGS